MAMGEVKTLKNRIGWIDIAKGICIIAVILGHHGVEALSFVYSFHLTVFFILSGYTLKAKPLTNEYIRNKFSRLMTPYFVTSFFVTVMEIINNFLLNHDYSTDSATRIIYTNVVRTFFASGSGDKFGDVNMYQPIGAIWFLPAMFFSLIFVQIIINKIKSEKLQMLVSIALAGMASASAGVIKLPFSLQAGVYAIPFILFGMLIKKYAILEKLKWYHYVVMAGIFAIGCHLGYAQEFYMVNCYAKDWFITIICALSSAFLILAISRFIKHFKPLEFVGRNSLIVLCVHLFELNTFYWHYKKIIENLGLPDTDAMFFALEIPTVLIISSIVVALMKAKMPNIKKLKMNENRDYAVDIMRLIAFMSLILCTLPINGDLIKLLFVFNFALLVMLAGYSFNSNASIKVQLLNAFKTLIPYAVFGVLYVLTKHESNVSELKTVLLGMTHSKNLLLDVEGLGVIALLLTLFIIKLAYIFIDKIKNDGVKHFTVLALFVGGIFLGVKGYWLPWSVDVALVGLGLYHLAQCMRKNDLLTICKNAPYVYFPLSAIFMYELYNSPVNFEWRGYFNVGIMVLGSISLFVILYNMSCYVVKKIPNFLTLLFSYVSKSAVYVLVINAIFAGRINEFVMDVIGFNEANLPNLVMILLIEVLIGAVVFIPIELFQNLVVNKKLKA